MEISEAIQILRAHNEWRKGQERGQLTEVEIAINTVCDALEIVCDALEDEMKGPMS